MQSSHILFILLTLFTLFISFPTSSSHITCECEDIPDDGTHNAFTNIGYSSNGASSQSSSSSTGSTANSNQGSSTTQIGSQTANSQQGGAGAQSNGQGTTDIDTDFDTNLKGFFSKVFAFGDSFTAGGSLLYHGSTTGAQSDHHQCIIDFLCDSLGLPPLPSFKKSSTGNFQHGVNFATPGASALPNDELQQFTRFGKIAAAFLNVTTESFLTQINWFNDFLNQLGCKQKDNCKEEFDKALFWLGGMGIDDHARTAGSTFSLQWLKEKSVVHISTMLHDVLKNGAKYVVVQGLPPLGCLLFEVSLCPHKHLNTLGCVIAVNAATMIHNHILQKTLENFRGQYPDAKIVYGDIWNAFLSILQNPAQYNFQETRKACCGTGGNLNFNVNALCGAPGTTTCADSSKYIFWDGIHLTAAMNKQLTHLILKQASNHLIK